MTYLDCSVFLVTVQHFNFFFQLIFSLDKFPFIFPFVYLKISQQAIKQHPFHNIFSFCLQMAFYPLMKQYILKHYSYQGLKAQIWDPRILLFRIWFYNDACNLELETMAALIICPCWMHYVPWLLSTISPVLIMDDLPRTLNDSCMLCFSFEVSTHVLKQLPYSRKSSKFLLDLWGN